MQFLRHFHEIKSNRRGGRADEATDRHPTQDLGGDHHTILAPIMLAAVRS